MPSVSVDSTVYQDLRQLKEMNDLSYSGVIGSLLRQVKAKTYDILGMRRGCWGSELNNAPGS